MGGKLEREAQAIEMLEAALPKLGGTERALVKGAIALLRPSPGTLRQRLSEAKKRRKPPSDSDIEPSESDAGSDGISDAESDGHASCPASLSSDPSGASELSVETSPSTGRAGARASVGDEWDAAFTDPPPRARLLTIWQRVALNGMPAGSASVHGGRLATLWPALTARAAKLGQEPYALFERVCVAYIADRKAKRKAPDTRFFVEDFDAWAERELVSAEPMPARRTMSEPVEPTDEHARRLRDLRARLRDTEALLDGANNITRPGLQEKAAWLRSEIEKLTTRAA